MRKNLLCIFLLLASTIYAKNDSIAIFQGCGGGMMVHAGYLFGENAAAVLPSGESISPSGMTYGLGGSMRVHLMKHLRVGCEGFSSTMKSGVTDQHDFLQKGSYIRTGWGGLIADACWRGEKIWPYIGGSVGGGATRALYIVEGSQDDWAPEQTAIFHKQGFGYVNPYVGMDYCLTKRIHATFRLDWMLAFAKEQLLLPTGPRLYVGIMFVH
jgi:hypothetical protein